MKIEHFPLEFVKALPILKKIQEAGFEAYFVGGCVRDCLLQHPIHDVDIATSATPYEVAHIFKKTFDLGIQHGTIAVLENGETYEITTFRTESGYEDFRRPDKVEFVRSLKEDLKRRDFTMNALAVDYEGNLIDLFDGLLDLEKKVIRAVGNPEERFFEDALRMMRGVRFAGQLGFTLEEETFFAMKKWHHLLENIAIERIRVEFEKLFQGEFAPFGLAVFFQSELYEYTPLLKNEGEAILNFQEALKISSVKDSIIGWTLLYDLLSSKKNLNDFVKAWKLPNDTLRQMKALMTYLPLRKQGFLQSLEIYYLGVELSEKLEDVLPFYGLTPEKTRLKEIFAALPIKKRQELAISGEDILAYFKKPGGKWVGDSIEFIEKQVVLGLVKNEKESLLTLIQEEFSWNKPLL